MNKKRAVVILSTFAACGIIAGIGLSTQTSKNAYILGADGNQIGTVSLQKGEIQYESDLAEDAYLEEACQEAVAVIQAQEGCSKEKAEMYLVKHELRLSTYFQQDVYDSLYQAYSGNENLKNENVGAVITDDHGHLLAGLSGAQSEDGKNYILNKTYAGSAIKPLSVYGPAIEDGTICWSSLVADEPYTKVKNEDGQEVDWPENTVDYTYQNTTIETAVMKSMNTIAVKTLKNYGVEKSCAFLEDQFGLDVDKEKSIIEASGEDEVLGDLALGYLKSGVSVMDMCGYYQVFANGGTYTEPKSVSQILQKDGSIYATIEDEEHRVFSEETAYIVNRLMKNVVSKEGTAPGAAIDGVDLCGKTGTSDDFKDNWFAGVVPGYAFSIWYGSDTKEMLREVNEAVNMAHDTFVNMQLDLNIEYKKPAGVVSCDYCEDSGLTATKRCYKTRTGFYNKKTVPQQCTQH